MGAMEKLLLLTLLVMGLTSCVVGDIEAPEDKAARVSPRITSLSPNNGVPSGATAITISGSDFDSATTATIGGSACTSLTFVSSSTLTCFTPASSVGARNVVVTNSRGLSGTFVGGYTYNSAPSVALIIPSAGGTAGGEDVTITGTGFIPGATVSISGVPCTSVSVLSSTSLSCTTGAQAATVAQAVVTNPDGQSSVAGGSYIYNNRPTVTALSANAGAIAGGTNLTITGTFFTAGQTSISIGGQACAPVVVATANSLTCTTGANTVGLKDVVVTNTLTSLNSTLANAYTYQAAPSFTSIFPTAGNIAGGTTVTVVGAGFDTVNGITVAIGGSSCGAISSLSATGFTCVTTARAAGTVSTVITNNDGDLQNVSAFASYTYQPGPTVSGLAPNAGALAGGTSTLVSGTGFVAGAVISIGGQPCAPVTFINATTLGCTTAANTAGSKIVTVTNLDTQTGSLAGGYTHQAAPTVTSVVPNGGPLAGGITVTVNGTGFDTVNTLNSVDFGGSNCGAIGALTATSFTCVTTAHVAGAVNVTVTNNDGDLQNGTGTNLFTYRNAPTVTGINPSAGPLAGGTAVSLTGTGFVTGATVTVGGVPCLTPSVLSGISITCVTGAHAAGITNVVVTNPDTQTGPGVGLYTYQAAPTITGVTPNAGSFAGGANITLTGTGFVAGATVRIDTFNCSPLTVVNATTITCTTTGLASAGARTVTVTNIDGQSGSLAAGFNYQAAPTVTSISPVGGDPAGGTPVTVVGTGFDTLNGVSAVNIGATSCVGVTVITANSLQCTTGASAAGTYLVAVVNNDGNSQTGVLNAAFTYQAAPTITLASPIGGPLSGGTTLTLTGTNFSAGATVNIGGAPCSAVTILSPTSLTCVTGASLAGAQNIVITNPDTQTGTLASGYTYSNPPSITSIVPNTGALAGGTVLSITGASFEAGSVVNIGGSACTPVTFTNANVIGCTTTANTAGPKDVTITNLDTQTVTNTNAFTYQAAPTLTSITPSIGTTLGNETVTLTGAGFDIINGVASVTIGGNPCLSFTLVSATSITCVTPLGSAGAADVVVTNADGDSQAVTQTNFFNYFAPPTVTSAALNNGTSAGGDTITITGTGFNNAGATTVTVGTFPCGSVTFISATSLSCVTGAATAGAYAITVTNFDGQTGTGGTYTYNPAPIFTSINNSVGPLAGGDTLIITGANFVTSPTVTIDANPCVVTFDNAGTINCTIPAGTAGAKDIVITNPDAQTATAVGAFTYAAAPTVTSVSPSVVDSSATTSITITGSDFSTTATPTVTIDSGGTNDSCANPVVSSGGSVITCDAPPHVAAAVNVRVENPDISPQANTPADVFTYVDPPTVVSAVPNSGVLTGGTSITITGTNFTNILPPTVTIGGVSCTSIVVPNATTMTCDTPANTAGAKDIVITNFGTLSGTGVGAFTYNPPPTVSSVDIANGPDTGGTFITITGTNFIAAATVTVDGITCATPNTVNPTTVTCTTGIQGAPTGAAGSIVVTNTDGQAGSLATLFIYTQAVTLASIAPADGSALGGETVTITGTNFFAGDTVTIGGSPCTAPNIVSTTSITCTTPALAAGTHDVIVTHAVPDSRASAPLAGAWTAEAVPTFSSLSDTSGTTTGGTSLTITGTNFDAGASVTFNGSAATVVSTAGVPTTLVVSTPPSGSVGAVDVVITNSTGQSVTAPLAFTYNAAGPELSWQEGAVSPNPPNPADYGTSAVNVSFTYALRNVGAVTTTPISISTPGPGSIAYFINADNCSGVSLAPATNCTVDIVFLGSGRPTGTYTATLTATAGVTSDTNALTGTAP